MKKIGFIGLGNMGPNGYNLLKANYEVIGYDVDKNLLISYTLWP